jgi:hypothetical protein
MAHRELIVDSLIALVAAVAIACGRPAGTVAPNPGTPASLPDWSGIWLPDIEDQFAQIETNPLPWTPDAAAEVRRLTEAEAAGHPKGLFANCLPEAMPAWMLVSHNGLEILFSPGRVTMLGESDGNRLRRIYTDGRSHPADPDPSFHGHSIGHWEGEALVVDTIGVLPQTYIAISEAVGVPNNGGLHVVERIHLAGADVLVDELAITAPKVLTATWMTTRRFTRHKGPNADILEGVCLQGSFAEQTDARGDAVFVPVPHTDEGNPVPPPLR